VYNELDTLDKKILEHLRKNSRLPYTEIAKIEGASESTIRNRIKQMINSGIITSFTVETSEEGAKALILISVTTSSPTYQIAEKISKMKGVAFTFETSGQYDISAVISGPDISSLNNRIDDVRNLDGISSTNSLIVLKSW
jgi:DNA-binding Lrp family transcriptional regulator